LSRKPANTYLKPFLEKGTEAHFIGGSHIGTLNIGQSALTACPHSTPHPIQIADNGLNSGSLYAASMQQQY